MKIEKINDSQIRCTLTGEDLKSRNIFHMSELAYGSQKARSLFHDMMEQAYAEYGFNRDNAPLTIEAIPTSSDSIVLIITKVDDPEELDTRFSRFTKGDEEADEKEELPSYLGADDIIDLFNRIREARENIAEDMDKSTAEQAGNEQSELSAADGAGLKSSANSRREDEQGQTEKHVGEPGAGALPPRTILHLFCFSSLDTVIEAAHALTGMKIGRNLLYKVTRRGQEEYLLLLYPGKGMEMEFNRLCNVLSEYGSGRIYSKAEESLLSEHGQLLLKRKALQTLAEF
ncbi:MAG: adaptor protein MecA [Eubacterium sp.]|nr:adaptor protein MecA [Eubacterium sp.]